MELSEINWKKTTQHITEKEKCVVRADIASCFATLVIKDSSSSIFSNIELVRDFEGSIYLEEEGAWSLRVRLVPAGKSEDIYFLEKLFEDPLHPTPDECTLFELEKGFPYPIGEILNGGV